jgi:putative membrane protein
VIAPMLGHGDIHDLGAIAWGKWIFEPFTVVLLVLSAACYARGVRALWARAGRGRGIRVWEATSFWAGLLVLAVALLSPLAWVSEILFSAHMTQHALLMLVSAPLLVFGRPLQAYLWALGPTQREAAGAWTRRRPVAATWHALTGPAGAFGIHGLALWLWHVPALYEAALRHQGVHALQHASFLLTAALFWWGMIHGRYGRIGYGAGVLYTFLTAVHSSILGALMTVATSLWYPSYGDVAAGWNIDAVEDQQLAGLLMWVPSGVIFIVIGLALLAAWLGESERRARLGAAQPRG